MSFTSLPFIWLTAAAVFCYYIVPKKSRWLILLAAAYLFYFCCGAAGFWYLPAVTLVTWGAGLWLGRFNDRSRAEGADKKKIKAQKKGVVAITLALVLGLLFLLKYSGGLAEIINRACGLHWRIDLIAPLGISYYIFQSLGYVIDCYRGKGLIERNPLKYALFVSFYPQMVQGPISRHRDLAPQLLQGHSFEAEHLRDGLQLMLWGYFKKLLIADRVGVIVGAVMEEPTRYDGSMIILAILCYCVQLYCDFSGGIDIARGIAELFGIHLPQNFKRPIFAKSLADYWRRWHITLGSWMRDYVFYPISLSKPFGRLGRWSRKQLGGIFGKILPTSLATFIIYLLIGFWHGSNPKYILYGFWNGIIITISILMEPLFAAWCAKLKIDRKGTGWGIFAISRTMLLIFIGRYITRAAGIGECLNLLYRSVFDFHLSLLPGQFGALDLTATDLIVCCIAIAAMLILEYLQERGMEIRQTLAKQRGWVQYLFLFLLLATVLIFGIWIKGEISTGFIYGNF